MRRVGHTGAASQRRPPLQTRTVYSHPIVSVEEFPVMSGGTAHTFVRMHHPDWVNLVPITDQGEVVLVRQHRHGIDAPTLEIPGGAIDPGEDASEAGIRELREETGFGGGRLVDLGWVHVNPAIQSNRTFLFALVGVRRVGDPEPDPTEEISVETVPGGQVAEMLADGRIRHSLAVVGLQRALLSGLLPR